MNNQSKTDSVSLWLEQLKAITAHIPLSHIDIIVDQTGLEQSLIPLLSNLSDSLQWVSLFRNTPEESLLEQSPLLIRIQWNKHSDRFLLNELLDYLATESRMLFLYSPLAFDFLVSVLQSLLSIKWGKQNCLFRFYDPRIFHIYVELILTEEQRCSVYDIAYMWGWLDRDHNIQWIVGNYEPKKTLTTPPTIEINDTQFSMIDGISDVTQLMRSNLFYRSELTKEHYFSILYQSFLQYMNSDAISDFKDYLLLHLPDELQANN